MCSGGTSSPSALHTFLYWMRAPSASCNWWKRTSLERCAVTTRTGTFTRPKLSEPFHIERGMMSRLLAHDVPRVLVDPEALVARVPQAAAFGPLGELELRHEAGLDEDDVLLVDGALERARVAPQRVELLSQARKLRVREARADAARVEEALRRAALARFVLRHVEHAHEERADAALPDAAPLRVAADDELLPALQLDLAPRAAPRARLVRAAEALRHDAFEARLREDRAPVAHDGGRDAHVRAFQPKALQDRSTLLVRLAGQVAPIEVEDVERHVDDGDLAALLLDGAFRSDA